MKNSNVRKNIPIVRIRIISFETKEHSLFLKYNSDGKGRLIRAEN